MSEIDSSYYQQIESLIERNPTVSGFDLYYLGFFSHFTPQLTLAEIFKHISNIISLHEDGLISTEEKIDFLIRMLSKKVDLEVLNSLVRDSEDFEHETKRILNDYFNQIIKILPKYKSINNFELFFLGQFHAICPAYKIAELFQHINNINALVKEDLIDKETQIDFLLKILNKKIITNKNQDRFLHIPRFSEEKSPRYGSNRKEDRSETHTLNDDMDETNQTSRGFDIFGSQSSSRQDKDFPSQSQQYHSFKHSTKEMSRLTVPEDEQMHDESENSRALSHRSEEEIKKDIQQNYPQLEEDQEAPDQQPEETEDKDVVIKEEKIREEPQKKIVEVMEKTITVTVTVSKDFIPEKPDEMIEEVRSNHTQDTGLTRQKTFSSAKSNSSEDKLRRMGTSRQESFVEMNDEEAISKLMEAQAKGPLSEEIQRETGGYRNPSPTQESEINPFQPTLDSNPAPSQSTGAFPSLPDSKDHFPSEFSFNPAGEENPSLERIQDDQQEMESFREHPRRNEASVIESSLDSNQQSITGHQPETLGEEAKSIKETNVSETQQSDTFNYEYSQLYSKKPEEKKPREGGDTLDSIFGALLPNSGASLQSQEAERRPTPHNPSPGKDSIDEEAPRLRAEEEERQFPKPTGKTPTKTVESEEVEINVKISSSYPSSQNYEDYMDAKTISDNRISNVLTQEYTNFSTPVTLSQNLNHSDNLTESQAQPDHSFILRWRREYQTKKSNSFPEEEKSENPVKDLIMHGMHPETVALLTAEALQKRTGNDSQTIADSVQMDTYLDSQKRTVYDTFDVSARASQIGDFTIREERPSQVSQVGEKESEKPKPLSAEEEEELSMKLIQQLQKEEQLAEERRQGKANCQVCLENLYSRAFKPIEKCTHVFHEDCIVQYLKTKIDQKGLPIKCPSQDCDNNITLADVVDLLGHDYQEKYVAYSIECFVDSKPQEVGCCPTANCPYAFLSQESGTEFSCPVCKRMYCLNCQMEMHEGITCELYLSTLTKEQRQALVEKRRKLKETRQFKECPNCKEWIPRKVGSNILNCQCGTEFCFNCGRIGDVNFCPCVKKRHVKPIVQSNLFHKIIQPPDDLTQDGNLVLGNANQYQPFGAFVPGGVFAHRRPGLARTQNSMVEPDDLSYKETESNIGDGLSDRSSSVDSLKKGKSPRKVNRRRFKRRMMRSRSRSRSEEKEEDF